MLSLLGRIGLVRNEDLGTGFDIMSLVFSRAELGDEMRDKD